MLLWTVIYLSSVFCVGFVTSECEQKPIKFLLNRFLPDYSTEVLHFESKNISDLPNGYYIQIKGKLEEFCKGSLVIKEPLNHFWCDDINVKYIEPGTFDNLNIDSQLRFSGTQLQKIEAGTFKNLPITQLELLNNQIEIIEPEAFVNLTKLSIVSLTRNKLTTLAWNAFVNTPKVQFFDASLNYLKELQDNQLSFMDKTTLNGIGFSNNFLQSINPKAFDGIKLFSLSFSGNKLSEIQDFILQREELRNLYFDNNSISTLQDEFFHHKNLMLANISGNPLDCATSKKLRIFKEIKPVIRVLFDLRMDCQEEETI